MKHTTTVQGPPTSAEWQLPADPTGLRITFQRHKVSFKEMQEASHKHLLLPTPNDLWLAKTLHDIDCQQLKPPTPSFLSGMAPLFMHTSRKPIKLSSFYVYINKHFDGGVYLLKAVRNQGCKHAPVPLWV